MVTMIFYISGSGEVTTPQLHFCVSLFNTMNGTYDLDCMSSDEISSQLLAIYYSTLLEGDSIFRVHFRITITVNFLYIQLLGFQRLCATAPAFKTSDTFSASSIIIDAANGVGSISVDEFTRFYYAHTEADL